MATTMIIGEKYENRKTGKIVVIADVNEKFKTLEYYKEDDTVDEAQRKTTNTSWSTFRKSFKKVSEEVHEQQEAPKKQKENKKAEKKVPQIEDKKAEKAGKNVGGRIYKVSPDRDPFIKSLYNIVERFNGTLKTYDKVPGFYGLVFNGKTYVEVRAGKKHYNLSTKEIIASYMDEPFELYKNCYAPAVFKKCDFTDSKFVETVVSCALEHWDEYVETKHKNKLKA